MKTVKAFREDGSYSEYKIPSKEEAIKQMEDTWGEQYDPVEGKIVKGGVPTLWKKLDIPSD